MKPAILALLFSLSVAEHVSGQCVTVPATPACTAGCTALTNGANVNTGQTYCYTGTGSVSNVNMAGGTITVCGNLTLSLNFNSGTIYVAPGGTLTMPGVNLGNASAIYNYGTLSLTSIITIQGTSGSLLMNATPSSVIDLNNNSLAASGTPGLVNNGTINNIGTLTIQNVPSVCLGNNSGINTVNITNNVTNSVSVPTGKAAIRFTGTANFNNPLTNTSNLKICQGPGATPPSSGMYGSAAVTPNCASNAVALPVRWLYAKAACNNGVIALEWATATEQSSYQYVVERSGDGSQWVQAGIVKASNNATGSVYHYNDVVAATGRLYYRIRQDDFSGEQTYTQVLSVSVPRLSGGLSLYPNPVKDVLRIDGCDEGALAAVLDMTGRVILQVVASGPGIELPVRELQPGIYILRSVADGAPVSVRFSRE